MLLIPWVFALDHVNYARWLSIHICDMCSLSQTHHNAYQQLCSGKFVAHKTTRPFSAMALDQAHERVNALVKGNGGAVGLTDIPTALRCWIISGPEISRMIQECKGISAHRAALKHHEQSPSIQSICIKEVSD